MVLCMLSTAVTHNIFLTGWACLENKMLSATNLCRNRGGRIFKLGVFSRHYGICVCITMVTVHMMMKLFSCFDILIQDLGLNTTEMFTSIQKNPRYVVL